MIKRKSSLLALVRPLLPERFAARLRPYRKEKARASDYRKGVWDYLDDLPELGHYSIIAGYYARLWPHGSVLDVGCGTGILQRALVPYNYSRYLGIDVSPDAIERASIALQAIAPAPNTVFQIGDMEEPLKWSGPPFDVVIVNEALYYAEKPVTVLARLAEGALAPNGIVIVSMHHTPNSQRLWQLLANHGWRPEDVTTVRNKAGTIWDVCVFRAPA